MKKIFIPIYLVLLLYQVKSFGVIDRRNAKVLSGLVVGKEVGLNSNLFSLTEDSFPEVQQYLDYILDIEKLPLTEKKIDSGAPLKSKKEALVKLKPQVAKFCKKVNKRFLHYGWGNSKCNRYPWNHVRNSVAGDPLTWITYGNETLHKN